ncbi:MAG: CapA family protein [Patescibacteria group bacterium]
MKKNLSFLLTLFLAACVAALFLSFIYPHTSRGVGVNPAPVGQTELKFCRAENLTTASKEEPPVKLLFFGDIMLDRHIKEKIKQKGFDYLFAKFELPAEWQQPDIMAANLEGAVTTGGKHYPPEISIDFAFDPKDVARLKNYNFNFFSIANNHITDQGKQGYIETRENLDKFNFNYSGCPDKQVGECNIKILNVKNTKIAALSYSMVYGILDEEKMLAQITDVKTRADLVIVNMHWGVEYEPTSRQNIQTLGHKIVDAGADMIIGGHPHVAQEMEIYNNKPIFYSLGNFIFDQYFSRETQEGLAVGIDWQDKKMEINLFPLQSKSAQVELMAGKNKQKFLDWLAESSKVNENYKEQIKNGNIVIASETK